MDSQGVVAVTGANGRCLPIADMPPPPIHQNSALHPHPTKTAVLHARSCIKGVIRFLFSQETRIMSAPDATTETHDDCALVRGWTSERKTRFLDHLALKGNVRASCKRVGLSREAAYRLRRRDAVFARGWAAA